MKRTLTVVPALVVAGLAVGASAQPASADVLPLPLPTTGTVLDPVTGTVTGTVGALLPTASPLPVPLPTGAPLPTPAPLPVPVPTQSVLPSTSPVGGTLTKPTKTVHQQSAGGTTVQPGTAADLADSVADALTGSTPGLQLSSASAPAWASALMGSTAFPSFPSHGGTAVVPMAIGGTRAGSTQQPTDVPGLLTATAVLSLVVAAGGQVLARSGRV